MADPTYRHRPAATDGHVARKRFGQHFLHDSAVIDRIVRVIQPGPGDPLVEIGPGLGALTGPLLAAHPHLTVIELDRELVPRLADTFGHHPGFRVVQADALAFDFGTLAPAGQKLRVVGNLPYNISTPLLFHLLGFADRIADMHFMLQKEVVERICADPDTEHYGRLSISVAARAEASWLFDVGAGAFTPPPRVESAVVRLRPRPPPFEIKDQETFDRVVREAFNHRRKTLGNALKGVCERGHFVAAGIDPMRRAETLSAEEFARLANGLY